ncbi:MAG: ComEC/Rec2 family competence protein [Anaerolineales bacterium]
MLFFALCASWLLGIVAARQLPMAGWQWLVLSGIAAVTLSFLRRARPYRITFSLLLVLTTGAARLQFHLPVIDAAQVLFYNDLQREVTLTGVVVNDPERRATYTQLVVRAERIRIPELGVAASVDGLVLMHASRLVNWEYGDWVRARGDLEAPPADLDFNYARVLANRDIYSWMPMAAVDQLEGGYGNPLLSRIYQLRHHLLEIVLHIFPDPEAQLMAGILLGVEGGISSETREAFDRTGTTHIIAISGFNLTLLAGASIQLTSRSLGRRRGALAAIAILAIYTLMVGADPPVVRAAIMSSIALIAGYLGRVSQALRTLGLAAVLMTLANPMAVFDVGFQLSFAAALGLILYADPLQQNVQGRLEKLAGSRFSEQITPLLSEYALFTLAAQVTTLPIIAAAFHRISLMSILTNLLVLPLQPGLMLSGGLAVMIGTISRELGRAAAWLAWPFPSATISLIKACARFPFSSLQLKPLSFAFPACYYAILLGLTLGWSRIRSLRFPILHTLSSAIRRSLAAVPMLSLLFVTALLSWHAYLRRPDGRLHLVLLDVGEGEAILIRSPAGNSMLINGGSSSLRLSDRLGPYFSMFERRLDWLILAGNGYNQLAGLTGLHNRYPVEQALLPAHLSGTAAQRLMEELNQDGVPIITAARGMRFDLGPGADLDITEAGAQGLALSLEFGAFRALLLPGADPEMISALQAEGKLESQTVIFLPTCGDPRVITPEMRASLNTVLLLSCEAGEYHATPTERTAGMLRTDLQGDIELISDGIRMWVAVERNP